MGEITSYGYQTFRDMVTGGTANKWDHILLYNDSGNKIAAYNIDDTSEPAKDAFTWINEDGDATLKVQGTVTKANLDTQTGSTSSSYTVEETSISTTAVDNDEVTPTESFANAHLNKDNDEVTITHTVEIPDV